MELRDALRRRRMVRRFEPDRVPDEAVITAVVDSGVHAPSAGFTQGVRYQVLERADVADFWAATTDPGPADAWLAGMRTAPVLVLVWTSRADYQQRYASPDKGWAADDLGRWSAPYWWVDAGMGVMAALLRAVDLGLGGCFFGVPPDRASALRNRFAVPEEWDSVGVIALGFPAATVRSSPRRARRPRSEVVRHGRWSESEG